MQETSTQDTGISEASLDGTGVSDGPTEGAAEGGWTDASEEGGHAEAGEEGGHVEAGSDGGEAEAGSDGGQAEAGTDAAQIEAGGDGGQTEEGGADASDSGSDAPTFSFSNPVQIDVSSDLTMNTIITSVAAAGILPHPIDGTANNNDFPTQAEAAKLTDAGPIGLPNDGFFPASGTTVPNVQLAWNDDGVHGLSTGNSIVIEGTAGTAVAFNVPQAQYDQVQIYATGGNGQGTLDITLNYTTGSAVKTMMTLPDWCAAANTVPANEYQLGNKVARVMAGNPYVYEGDPLCGIWAIDLSPDTTRVLTSISITDNGPANSYFVFYGATAW
jgi:hypothetical protein